MPLAFFLSHPDLDLPLHSLESEYPLLSRIILLSGLIPPSSLQEVSASDPFLLTLFHCPDLSLLLWSLGGECHLLTCFHSLCQCLPPSSLYRKWVPFTCSLCLLSWIFPLSMLAGVCPSLSHTLSFSFLICALQTACSTSQFSLFDVSTYLPWMFARLWTCSLVHCCLCPHFSLLQAILSKLSSFCAKVLLLF